MVGGELGPGALVTWGRGGVQATDPGIRERDPSRGDPRGVPSPSPWGPKVSPEMRDGDNAASTFNRDRMGTETWEHGDGNMGTGILGCGDRMGTRTWDQDVGTR